MQFLKFTATLMDKEWIEGNKDRETYRERKEEICDRTENLNEGKEDVFFITDMLGARIRGALVKDDKDLCRGVVDFMRIICVSVDVSAPEEIIFTDLRLRLGIAYRGGKIYWRQRADHGECGAFFSDGLLQRLLFPGMELFYTGEKKQKIVTSDDIQTNLCYVIIYW